MEHQTVASLTERERLIGEGARSAQEFVATDLSAVLAREPELHAWVSVDHQASSQAEQLPAGPLSGVSVGVKDIIDVAGSPTRCGSPVTSSEPASQDAQCVARLRDLGAVVLGKTVTTEFGYFSPGPTTNPVNSAHTPGGSSSGSASAVGGGTIPLALGTQTAGSLTRPASYCGAAGMVLTPGTTDLTGITGLSDSLDSLGLLTRSVSDLRLVFRAFMGHTPRPEPPVSTVYAWDANPLAPVDEDMSRALQIACEAVRELGYDLTDLDYDDHVATLAEDHITVMGFEAARTHATLLDEHSPNLSEPFTQLLTDGHRIPEDEYRAALVRRDRTWEQFHFELGADSIVIGPAAQGAAPKGLSATGSPILSRPWQLLGCPVVTVAGLRNADGMPLGIQLIGPHGREESLFDLGERLEESFRRTSHPVATP